MNYIQKVSWLSSLLILKFFISNSYAALSLLNLTRVCTYFFPFDTTDVKITPPEDFCTAVATYNELGLHPPPKDLDMIIFKNGLPYVHIYDEFLINAMKNKVDEDNVQAFIDYLTVLINEKKIDVMVFDFLDTMEFILGILQIVILDDEFQNDLKSFFDKMKKAHPDMLFGLKIHKSVELNNAVFNHHIIDDSIDFYVINPYDGDYCQYMDYQSEMAPPPSKDEMCKTIEALEASNYDAKKLFFIIEVLVKSWKDQFQPSPEDWSYSWLCEAKPGNKRKYCRGHLNNFYDQGSVIHEKKLPGVFIQAIDCDDFKDNCLCGSFPAARAIYDGLTGATINTTLINCESFAILANDR